MGKQQADLHFSSTPQPNKFSLVKNNSWFEASVLPYLLLALEVFDNLSATKQLPSTRGKL